MILNKRFGAAALAAALVASMMMPAAAGATSGTDAGPAQAPAAPIAAAKPAVDAASNVEALCGPAEPGYARCLSLRRTDVATTTVSPHSLPSGYGPADLASAYALPAGLGAGMTVAIVDAFDLPTAASDLAAYRSAYGLPACTTANGCFRKVNQNGVAGSYPVADDGWGGEIALDLDMVSAACPACNILLVEATDPSMSNLATAVNTAVSMGAVAVSNSYGGLEVPTVYSVLDAYYNHPGVAIVASSGDCGYNCAPYGTSLYDGVEFPAASKYVVSVGGTSLSRSGNARGWTESVWANDSNNTGPGSGCSLYETKPAWQTDPSCSRRMSADVSAVSDPNTGVAVYLTTSTGAGWGIFGGTSAASPIIASIYAMAGTPTPGTYPAYYPYVGRSSLNDVTSGTNNVWGDCTIAYYCDGVAGYDGPTGLGTPNGVHAFSTPFPGAPASASAARGDQAATVSWTAPSSDGASSVIGYTVTSTPSSGGCTWIGGPRSCTVTGLTNGTSYAFQVTAQNAIGSGPGTTTAAVTPAGLPLAPTGVTAAASNLSAEVAWSASGDNGSAISGYTVSASDGVHTCAWASGPLSCVVPGLLNGTSYTFQVRATNGVGTGSPSTASGPVTPAAVPDRPTGVTATGGHASATVSWPAPADNGSAITAYAVSSTPASAGCSTTGALTCGVSGLTNGTPYTFSVTATNDAGPSLKSLASNSVTPMDVPGAPGGVTAVSGKSSATVSWAAAATNGATVTGYTVTSTPASAGCTWTSGPLSCTVSGLTQAASYSFTVTATNSQGTGPSASSAVVVISYNGATYHAVSPSRVLDSRIGLGGSRFSSRVKQTVTIANGASGVPADAVAVTGNVTITEPTREGYVTVAPSLTSGVVPATSTINFPTADTRANAVIVPLAPGGKLDVMYWSVSASATVSVIFDVTGYFANDTNGATYHTVTPARVLDSRIGLGGSRFSSRVKQTVTIANGASGVPADAVAVTGNVTITEPTREGYVTVAPSLTSGVVPATSTINFPTADTRANAVTVPLAPGGKLDVMYWSVSASATVSVIFDVTGYFANDTNGATYHTVTPARVLDSRIGLGGSRFSSRVKQTVTIANGASGVPADAVAVTGNVTITEPTREGYVTVAPSLTSGVVPATSTINFPTADTRANAVTVPLAPGGKLDVMYWSVSASATVSVIFDVTGYFGN